MQSFLLKTGSQNRDTESHFFWLQILPHELGWNVALVLAKTFLRWSQRSYLNMKKQRFRSVFCTNLENPCFLLNKDIWIHYLRLIVDNLIRSFALLKCWDGNWEGFTATSTSLPRSLHGHSLKWRTFSDYFSFIQLHIHIWY